MDSLGDRMKKYEDVWRFYLPPRQPIIQSDEISVLLVDYKKFETQPWFGNVLQKIVSVTAAKATAEFNRFLYDIIIDLEIARQPEWARRFVGTGQTKEEAVEDAKNTVRSYLMYKDLLFGREE